MIGDRDLRELAHRQVGHAADRSEIRVADDTDRIDTKRAMALPLVRQVIEHFDVSVLDARKVSPKQEK